MAFVTGITLMKKKIWIVVQEDINRQDRIREAMRMRRGIKTAR